jgi:hypothetical protein
VTVVLNTKKACKTLMILTTGFLISGCTAIMIAGGVVGAGVAVATTAVGVGVSVGTTAVSATTKVVKAAIPSD